MRCPTGSTTPRVRLRSLTGGASTTSRSGPSASTLSSAARQAARSSGTGSVSESQGSSARGLGSTRAESITPTPSRQSPDRPAWRAALEDHVDHVDDLAGLDDLVDPEDAGAVHRGNGAGSQGAGEALSDRQVEG